MPSYLRGKILKTHVLVLTPEKGSAMSVRQNDHVSKCRVKMKCFKIYGKTPPLKSCVFLFVLQSYPYNNAMKT